MPYVTYAPKGKVKKIIEFLRGRGLVVHETELPEYFITVRDPRDYLPKNILSQLVIKAIDENYTTFLKDAGRLGVILRKWKTISPGDAVKIIDGPYKDFIGIVRSKDGDYFKVEISVFGKMISETIEGKYLEKMDKV